MQEGICKLHILQIFLSSVSARRHLSRLKSQTWSEKYEHTSNFNVAELYRQKSVCGSASGKSKECSSFRSSTIFSYQCQHENAEVERRDMTRLKYMKKTETSTQQNSLYLCLFVALSVSRR
jgi:hypothetical protein